MSDKFDMDKFSDLFGKLAEESLYKKLSCTGSAAEIEAINLDRPPYYETTTQTFITKDEYCDGEHVYRLKDLTLTRDEDGDLIMMENVGDGNEDLIEEGVGGLLISLAGFCGCACHDAAVEFFLIQLRDFKEGKNYFNMPGGLDYFKVSCYDLGILDKNFDFTDTGLFLLGLANKAPDLTAPNPVLPEQVKIEFKSDGAKDFVLSLMTDRLNNEIPEGVDKYQLLNLLYFYVSSLGEGTNKLYDYREKHPGECTLTLYWMDSIFELEEHGGSTPGWLVHGQQFKWSSFKDALVLNKPFFKE